MTHTVAISGANGYLGSLLKSAFAVEGWHTIRLVRSPSNSTDRMFRLGNAIDPSALHGVDLLIHCAYDMSIVSPVDISRLNVAGTERLLDAAESAGVPRTIVLSSMSAYAGTEQLYGRAKLEIEGIAQAHGAVSVRPGLVVGKKPGGMAGNLAHLAALPFTPCLSGVGRQFLLDEIDFVSAILLLADTEAPPTEPVGLAYPRSVDFATVLRAIAAAAGLRSPRLVPVPWQLIEAILRSGERLRIPMPFRSDSLLGLRCPAPVVPHAEYWDEIGLQLHDLGV